MVECHTKLGRKKIAKKKAKLNEEKLEELVDQLHGKIESTATAEVKCPKIIHFFTAFKTSIKSNGNNRFIHIYPETRRP